jgi:hypothetical protein
MPVLISATCQCIPCGQVTQTILLSRIFSAIFTALLPVMDAITM